MFGPFGVGLRFVKRLPRNGFPDNDAEGLVAVLVHLVSQIEHGDVEFDA